MLDSLSGSGEGSRLYEDQEEKTYEFTKLGKAVIDYIYMSGMICPACAVTTPITDSVFCPSAMGAFGSLLCIPVAFSTMVSACFSSRHYYCNEDNSCTQSGWEQCIKPQHTCPQFCIKEV